MHFGQLYLLHNGYWSRSKALQADKDKLVQTFLQRFLLAKKHDTVHHITAPVIHQVTSYYIDSVFLHILTYICQHNQESLTPLY